MQLGKFDAGKPKRVCSVLIVEKKAVWTFKLLMGCPSEPCRRTMKKRCPNCQLVNYPYSVECARCQFGLIEVATTVAVGTNGSALKLTFFRRALICAGVCCAALLGFYLSLIFTSDSLKYNEKQQIQSAVSLLAEKGFDREVFLLRYLTAFRANDNWLNASTKFENAYAATNFPFEIVTVYPEFFTYPADDTERAAILLHEAQHLKGADEKEAYEFVWRSRKKLGWTKETHGNSAVWRNIRRQTQENAPHLFVCDWNEARDCTE